MRLPLTSTLACALLLAGGLADAQPARAPSAVKPIAPASSTSRASPSPAIIVQGGISPNAPCDTAAQSDRRRVSDVSARATGGPAIHAKQDDPTVRNASSRDLASAMAPGRGAVAIGPKQDDPAPPPPADLSKCMPASH